ncbi:S26 family signal peptidase [Streptomyces sp. NPDC058545]|uniref:S26 family signal peptidase n=1 Tax=Streptomyces sp. NPDC058545 TaxID=3346544 RepID=UPI00365ABCA6
MRLGLAALPGAKVRRGDVVLFDVPERFEGKPVLKRVIGLRGDHVVFDGTRLTVDKTLDDVTAPVLLGLGVLLGVVLAPAGAVCTSVGWVKRWRRPAPPALVAHPVA